MRRKTLNESEIDSAISSIQTLLRESGIENPRVSTLSELLKQCICCPDFRKVLKIGSDSSLTDTTIEIEDASTPSGVHVDAYLRGTRRTRFMPTIRITIEADISRSTQSSPEFYAYVYNLPLRVSEQEVRDALCNVGDPAEIFIFDTRGIPIQTGNKLTSKPLTEQQFRLSSPVNAIIRFNTPLEYEKATRLENKLFGILCRSTDPSIDGSRTMFIEPAERKTSVLVSRISCETTLGDFEKTIADSVDLVDPRMNAIRCSSDPQAIMREEIMTPEERIAIEFPNFQSAFSFVKTFQDHLMNVQFSSHRTQSLPDGKFRDSQYFIVHD